ncbi:MAG: TPM domain-containing protein [Bacteroidetes bacterium]|nr:TPM domain-containing protein [Bacteroidota bacterium]
MSAAKRFLTDAERDAVIAAIQQAERFTSGEIRVHIGNFCLGSEIRMAQKIFTRLGMHKTRERNGVLIYIAVMNRKLAVIGDAGIHEKLGSTYWETLVSGLITKIKSGKKGEGLAESILDCGRQLSHYFPRQSDDTNELSDTISY